MRSSSKSRNWVISSSRAFDTQDLSLLPALLAWNSTFVWTFLLKHATILFSSSWRVLWTTSVEVTGLPSPWLVCRRWVIHPQHVSPASNRTDVPTFFSFHISHSFDSFICSTINNFFTARYVKHLVHESVHAYASFTSMGHSSSGRLPSRCHKPPGPNTYLKCRRISIKLQGKSTLSLSK